MRLRILAAVAVSLAAATSFVSAAQAQVVVTVSKSQQKVAVTVDGNELYRWPVSTGRRGYDTPVGQYRPVRLERDWYSRKYDWAPMPHSVFFYKGYAMHGTTEERNLGRVASHGCVRLSRSNAATLFALLRERRASTKIVVTNASLPAVPSSPFMANKPVKQADAGDQAGEAKVEAKADDLKPIATPVKLAAAGPISLPVIEEETPLPKARPVIEESKIEAKAEAKSELKVQADKVEAIKPRPRVSARDTFASVGDEATVMRGREAWLRSLDRKYGITR